MSTPSESQRAGASVLKEVREIISLLPDRPEALTVNKVELQEADLGRRKSVDLDLGDGRTIQLTLWGKKR